MGIMRIIAFPPIREARRRLARRIAQARRAELGQERGWMCMRDPAQGTLGLVTLLGMDRDRTLRFMKAVELRLAHLDRLVFVVSCDDIAGATRDGSTVEQMPGPLELCGGQRAAQVAAYLEARLAQIQRKWEPDFTFSYGLDEAAYCRKILATQVEISPEIELY